MVVKTARLQTPTWSSQASAFEESRHWLAGIFCKELLDEPVEPVGGDKLGQEFNLLFVHDRLSSCFIIDLCDIESKSSPKRCVVL